MSTPTIFSIETSSQRALILTPDTPLAPALVSVLKHNHLEVASLLLNDFMSNPPLESLGDYDYLVILADPSFLSWLSTGSGLRLWNRFLSLPPAQTRLVLVAPLVLSDQLPPPSPNVRVCLFGEYFALDYSQAPTLEKSLLEAIQTKTLTIPGDGLQDYHLLHQDDLLQGLQNVLFSSSCPSPIYLLNPTAISLLSLAYRLRSSLPHKTTILFDEKNLEPSETLDWENILSGQAQILWSPEKNLETELPLFIKNFLSAPHPFSSSLTSLPPASTPSLKPRFVRPSFSLPTVPSPASEPSRHLQPLATLLKSFRQEPNHPLFVLKSKQSPQAKLRLSVSRHPHPYRRLLIHSLLTAFLLYVFSLVLSLAISYFSLRSLTNKLKAGNYHYSQNLFVARATTVYFEANLFVLRSVPWLNTNRQLSELNSLVLAFHQGLGVLDVATPLIDTGQTLFTAIFSDQQIDLNASLSLARLQIAELYRSLALFDGVLAVSPPSLLPPRYVEAYSSLKNSLQLAKHQALVAKAVLQIAHDFIGVGDRRQYAILFQNNMELRATGGFIGSFALPSFENGKLFELPIFDVYSADGQLKGHVEPPAPIKKYLGEANWYLRDSNWDPDFPTSARRAEWFLNKTISEEVDGVIAINLDTLKNILHALGPVTLPDYNEEINEDNLFSRAEYYAEVNFFPGSTQKKEFLSSVTTALISQLPNLSRDKSLAFALAILKSIDQKNTLISLSDPNLNSTFSLLGWNGELRNPPCPILEEKNCFNDYAMLVDSNFGVNKANYFIKRKFDLVTTIDKNRLLKHRLTTTYTNTAASTAWPAGNYKNYSRLYLPHGSVVEALIIDGKQIDQKDLVFSTEHGRLVVGFLVEVPISSTLVVDIDYQVGALSENSPAYTFYWQKQPGTESDPLTIYLNYPLFLSPRLVSPPASINEQQLQFNLTNITDRRVTVQF